MARTNATKPKWNTSYVEVRDLTYNIEDLGNGTMRCTTESKHYFVCDNDTGDNADSIPVEYNHTIEHQPQGLPWAELIREATPPTLNIDVDEGAEYDQRDLKREQSISNIMSAEFDLEEDTGYRIVAYTSLSLTDDNIQATHTVGPFYR